MVKMARITALQLLVAQQEIELPYRAVNRSVAGASGKQYVGEAVAQGLRVRIRRVDWVDDHAATLTLENGRVVRFQLVGRISGGGGAAGEAAITIIVDDPEVSTWSPSEILARAQLEGSWMCWERHWDDDDLAMQAQERAIELARSHLDIPPEGFVLPDGLLPQQQSETILHWYLKSVIAASPRIWVPGLTRTVRYSMPDGSESTRQVSIAPTTLSLSGARSEHDLVDIVPDLMVRAHDESGKLEDFELMIEVAVTHRVDAAKTARIVARNIACLEIDASRLGVAGRQPIALLRELVVGNPDNKQWIHHPVFQALVNRAQDELESIAAEQLEARARLEALHQAFAASSDQHALNLFLERKRMAWGGGREPVDGISNQKIGSGLIARGFRHLEGPEFSGPTGVLRLLDGLRLDGARGVSSSNALIVLKRIEEEESHQRFASLYLLALKKYTPRMSAQIMAQFADLRSRVVASLRAEEMTFARPTTWDSALGALFPELASGIATGFGTAAQVDLAREARVQAERRAAEELRRRESEAQAQATRERQAAGLQVGVESIIQATVRRFAWLPADDGHPFDVEGAVEIAYETRQRAYAYNSDWARSAIESAWSARAAGTSLEDWLVGRQPPHGGEVIALRDLLDRAWIITEHG